MCGTNRLDVMKINNTLARKPKHSTIEKKNMIVITRVILKHAPQHSSSVFEKLSSEPVLNTSHGYAVFLNSKEKNIMKIIKNTFNYQKHLYTDILCNNIAFIFL